MSNTQSDFSLSQLIVSVEMSSQKYTVPYWPSEEGMSTKQQCVTIVVEGNIGAGKSTLLRQLGESSPDSYDVSCIENVVLDSDEHKIT